MTIKGPHLTGELSCPALAPQCPPPHLIPVTSPWTSSSAFLGRLEITQLGRGGSLCPTLWLRPGTQCPHPIFPHLNLCFPGSHPPLGPVPKCTLLLPTLTLHTLKPPSPPHPRPTLRVALPLLRLLVSSPPRPPQPCWHFSLGPSGTHTPHPPHIGKCPHRLTLNCHLFKETQHRGSTDLSFLSLNISVLNFAVESCVCPAHILSLNLHQPRDVATAEGTWSH